MSFIVAIVAVLTLYLAWRILVRNNKKKQNEPSRFPIQEQDQIRSSGQSNQPATVEDKDAWEGWFIDDAKDPKPSQARLKITYVDGSGKLSNRDIEVQEFENSPSNSATGLIMAHCLVRNARRTFRYDRIQHAVDLETGEVINNIQEYLRGLWVNSPKHALEQFGEQFQEPLQVLLFIARADGRLTAKERAVILEFCKDHLPDQRISDEELVQTIRDTRQLSIHAFKVSVGRLLKHHPELISHVIKTAKLIVASEKTVHPSELEALEYLDRRLKEDSTGSV